MQFGKGARLGPYEIEAPLGAGGMGEVYRAHDSRLGRTVAIKVLPETLAADERARARFSKEARAIAALSHPNICTIHDIGEAPAPDGSARHYLVMECLEGETLDRRLARGPLSLSETLRYGAEIADALDRAHRHGIIHRDLKPSNIMITESGAKLLDFGLARRDETRGRLFGASVGTGHATEARTLTGAGTIIGTLQYMAPEQLQGETSDARTDIFALGMVLYEMATGRKAFEGASQASLIAAILEKEPPPMTVFQPLAPAAFDHVVRRCLQKTRGERWQSAGDVARELRWIAEGQSQSTGKPSRLFAITAAVGGIAAIAALVFGSRVMRQEAIDGAGEPRAIRVVAVLPFENVTKQEQVEFLTDGITEGLINSLSRLRETRVIARTTAFTFKGRPVDLEAIRNDLGADAIVTGRIALRDDTLVVQADLIDTASGAQLWGDRFVRSPTGAMAIEQEIVGQIADQLQPELGVLERQRITAMPTENPEAYALYLKGRTHFAKRTAADLAEARALYRKALQLDPQFALAHSSIAESFVVIEYQGGRSVREKYLAEAEAAAQRALQINPDLGEPYAALGLAAHHRYHFRKSERLLRRAVQQNPNYATARHWFAMALSTLGRHDEALAEFRKAQLLDPLSPQISTLVGTQLVINGDYAAALEQTANTRKRLPSFTGGYATDGFAFEALGQYENAAAAYQVMLGGGTVYPFGHWRPEAHLARVYAKMGRTEEALETARNLERQWRENSDRRSATLIGSIYVALGDHDRAFEWLNRALAARESELARLLALPIFAEIRSDPRYAALQKAMLSFEEKDTESSRGGARASSAA